MVLTGSPVKRFIEDNGLKRRGQGGWGLTPRLRKEGGGGGIRRLGMRAAVADRSAEAGLGFCRVGKSLDPRRWTATGRRMFGERRETKIEPRCWRRRTRVWSRDAKKR